MVERKVLVFVVILEEQKNDDLSVLKISRNINKSLAQVVSDFTKYIYESAGQLNNYDN